MEIKLLRNRFFQHSTGGDISIDGKFICNTLEDTNREIKNFPVSSWKIDKVTCIPSGRYKIIWTYSNHFGKILLQLLDVMGFKGIRIHKGNKPEDTEGCILVGFKDHEDWITGSVKAYDLLIPLIDKALKDGEEVYINICVDEKLVKIY